MPDPHDVVAAHLYDGDWQILNAGEIYGPEKITVTQGFAEEGTFRPSKIQYTIQDDHDNYRPTNPEATWYGVAGRNMPSSFAADATLRAVGEASAFLPGRTRDFRYAGGVALAGRRWVDFEAQGILRRLGKWTEPLRSAMYRWLQQYSNLIGLWSLEDSRDADQLSNGLAGGEPGELSGSVTLGEDGGPGGAGTVAKLGTGGRLYGRFAYASSSIGWQISLACKLAATPASGTYLPLLTWKTSNGYVWSWSVNNIAYRMKVDQGDTTLLDETVLWGTGAEPTGWVMFRHKVSISGSTVTVEQGWYPEANPSGLLYGTTDTFSGSLGRLTEWYVEQNAHNLDALYTMVFAVKNTTDNLQLSSALGAFNGNVGEKAGARFKRLCDELGVSRTLTGTESLTMPMGPQKPDTFLNLLREIADTEDAMIMDRRTNVGLVMRTRDDRYAQTPALELTFPDDVAEPFDEALDDDQIWNRVTVSQRDGGDATATAETGPLSVQLPPDGVGEYKRKVDVNVYRESSLEPLAGWYLSKGTQEGARYPSVTVDLDAHPELAAATLAVEVGDLITIDGYEAGTVRLIVIGIVDQLSDAGHRYKVTFTCVRGDVWQAGTYDDAGSRWDSASTTLAGTETTTSTTWELSTVSQLDVWSTVDEPYDCEAGGEVVTVTNMTAATGTGPFLQTATVTRSVNGVVKSHAAGEQFRLANPVRYAL